jgi:tetratricopeptide (TPR) repeat protein
LRRRENCRHNTQKSDQSESIPQNAKPTLKTKKPIAQLGDKNVLTSPRATINIAVALLANIYSNLGHALDETEAYDDAIKAFHKSLEIEQNAGVMNKLGACLSSQNRLNEAIEQFMAALAIAPEDATVHYNIAAAYASHGKVGFSSNF